MKKLGSIALLSAAITVFIIACKHQPVDDGGIGSGTGSGNGTGGGGTTASCSPDTAYFQQQVLPIFISNCALAGCHTIANGNVPPKGVVLTNYNSIINTGDVRPGRPNDSEIWEKITDNDPSDRMPPPPRNPLTQAQRDIIFKWIMQGALNNSCQSSTCDSSNVTFSGTIRNIISNKCLGCHSSTAPQGGINYSTYAGVKAKVDDGRLWGAINQFPGYSPMPKGGTKLSDCEIRQFRKWIDAGAPNN